PAGCSPRSARYSPLHALRPPPPHEPSRPLDRSPAHRFSAECRPHPMRSAAVGPRLHPPFDSLADRVGRHRIFRIAPNPPDDRPKNQPVSPQFGYGVRSPALRGQLSEPPPEDFPPEPLLREDPPSLPEELEP